MIPMPRLQSNVIIVACSMAAAGGLSPPVVPPALPADLPKLVGNFASPARLATSEARPTASLGRSISPAVAQGLSLGFQQPVPRLAPSVLPARRTLPRDSASALFPLGAALALGAGALRWAANRRLRQSLKVNDKDNEVQLREAISAAQPAVPEQPTFKRMQFKRKPPTPRDCVPEEILAGPYGKECELLVSIMASVVHAANMALLYLEAKKPKQSIGYAGSEMEKLYFRNGTNGERLTLVHVAIALLVGERLREAFPEDVILCEEDLEIIAKDQEFGSTIKNILTEHGLINKDSTYESMVDLARHCRGMDADSQEPPPQRYWVLKAVDCTDEFLETRPFGVNLALIDNGKPVVAGVASPIEKFDHVSRTAPSVKGCPFYFAVAGQGSYTQLVNCPRSEGFYSGNSWLYGKPLRLKVEEKVKRKHDGLYDFLATEQLSMAIGNHYREDIFRDAERIGNNLGSEYPKFTRVDSNLKYAWLAGGTVDSCFWLTTGLYNDAKGTERMVDHVAGCLIAEEAGAIIADLDGNPIEWCGPVLSKNRGMMALDPNKVPLPGAVKALVEASTVSTTAYEDRCEKRKEVATFLSDMFSNMDKHCDTEEEKRNVKIAQQRGAQMLENQEQMMEAAQDSMNMEVPILGEGPAEEPS